MLFYITLFSISPPRKKPQSVKTEAFPDDFKVMFWNMKKIRS
nr:MAG TPA: hypothetical protein [Bacteriophage sp.]